MPDWYLAEPEVTQDDLFFTTAYDHLSTCRVMDGPIPWTAVKLYADQKSLDVDVADMLWEVIRIMDAAEARWHQANPPPKDAPPTPRGDDG